MSNVKWTSAKLATQQPTQVQSLCTIVYRPAGVMCAHACAQVTLGKDSEEAEALHAPGVPTAIPGVVHIDSLFLMLRYSALLHRVPSRNDIDLELQHSPAALICSLLGNEPQEAPRGKNYFAKLFCGDGWER